MYEYDVYDEYDETIYESRITQKNSITILKSL